MAKLMTVCPNCGAKNEVGYSTYMRLDSGKSVTCWSCQLRFCAAIDEEDDAVIFEGSSVIPTVKGDKDYFLKAEYYPVAL